MVQVMTLIMTLALGIAILSLGTASAFEAYPKPHSVFEHKKYKSNLNINTIWVLVDNRRFCHQDVHRQKTEQLREFELVKHITEADVKGCQHE